MATAHETPTPPPAPAPSAPVKPPAPAGDASGLIWGGAMLVLYAIWLGKSFPELATAVVGVFWLLGLGGIAVGIWQWTLDVTARERQRSLVGGLLILAGAVLAGMTAYLVWTLRLQGFSASVGLGLFALIPLISGLVHVRPAASAADVAQRLLKSYILLQNSLLILGVAGILVFLWLSFFRKLGLDWFPELAALLFESLLCITCAFWLIASQPAERTEFALRCLLLVLGAGTGLFVVLYAAALTYVWQQDVVLGGLVAWQSDANGWKFWLCSYVGLVGLVLMFASVLLVRSEVRSHPVLRLSLYGYNSVVTGLLLLAFLVTLNVVCYAMFPMTFEWTSTRGGMSALSPASKSLLGSLKEPTTVYVLLSQQDPVFTDIQALMGNCLVYTDKMKVKYISPDTDFRAFDELAQRYPEILPSARAVRQEETTGGRGLLIVYGSEETDKKAPHSFIPERKLMERPDHMMRKEGKPTVVFKGEIELMNELDFLTRGKEDRKIYFLQGDEELDINNSTDAPRHSDFRDGMAKFGAGRLVDRLKKDNYKISGLSFGRKIKDKADNTVYVNESGTEARPNVPEDAWALVIAGASEELSPEAIDALERYVDKGGKLFITFDVVLDSTAKTMKKTGMQKFVHKYGVEVEDSFLMRLDPEDPRMVYALVPSDTANDLGKQFLRKVFPFDSIRAVRPGTAAKYKADVLLEAPPRRRVNDIWVETAPRAMQTPGQYFQELAKKQRELFAKLAKEPVPVAVTVSTDTGKPRMVVVGDTDFLANENMNPTDTGEKGYALFVSAMEWMAERKGYVGPRAKVSQIYSFPADVDRTRMVFLPVWFMFLGTVGLGISVWLIRRR